MRPFLQHPFKKTLHCIYRDLWQKHIINVAFICIIDSIAMGSTEGTG